MAASYQPTPPGPTSPTGHIERTPEPWACKRSRLGSALPCPAGRSVPGRGGPERRRRPRPDGTGTQSVRAGSASDRRTVDNSRHQRSLNVSQNRRSLHLQSLDLVWRRRALWSSSLPTRPPRALRALSHEAVVTRTGLTLRPSWEPGPPGASIVVLTGEDLAVPLAALVRGCGSA